jgi:hypothetical protein
LAGLNIQKKASKAVKAIDKTIPNLFDESVMDAVDLEEFERWKHDNLPGKNRRSTILLDQFNNEEISRLSLYSQRALQFKC